VSADERTRLWELVKDLRVGMLTTLDADGSLSSRPMTTQQTSFDGTLWFFAPDDGPLAEAIAANSIVNVSYANPSAMCFVSVSGVAELVRDVEHMRRLWNPVVDAWFPRGPSDPHVALIRVDVQQAEYWEASSSRMVQLFGIAKALVTRRPPTELGDHHEVKL
jgi:general stress protein 26